MRSANENRQLAEEVNTMLGEVFPGIHVDVAHSPRWDRMCITFRWAGFAGLLVEERFHRLTQVIPESFRASKLAGFVWLELSPDEAIDDVLKQSRSEDVESREQAIYSNLVRAGYFTALAEALGSAPKKQCSGDFSETVRWGVGAGFTDDMIRDAKLVFIRRGGYCDCQVLLTLHQQLAETYPLV